MRFVISDTGYYVVSTILFQNMNMPKQTTGHFPCLDMVRKTYLFFGSTDCHFFYFEVLDAPQFLSVFLILKKHGCLHVNIQMTEDRHVWITTAISTQHTHTTYKTITTKQKQFHTNDLKSQRTIYIRSDLLRRDDFVTMVHFDCV